MNIKSEIDLYYKIRNQLIEIGEVYPADHDFIPCMLFVGMRMAILNSDLNSISTESESVQVDDRVPDDQKLKKVFLASGGKNVKRGRIVQIWQDLYGESVVGIDKKLKTFVEQGMLIRESGFYSLQ